MAKTQHAPIDSPAFLGTPTAPTPGVNDIGSRIATTAYVQARLPPPQPNEPITLSGDVAGRGTSAIAATVTGLRGHPLALDAPADTDVLQWSQAAWAWGPVRACEIGAQPGGAQGQLQVNDGAGYFTGITVSGDAVLNTTSGVATVTGLRSRPVSATAPADGQVLAWSQANNNWRPATVTGSAGVDAPADGFYYGRQNASWQKVAPLDQPVFTGDARLTTAPALSDNDTSIPTTAWVKGQGYLTANQPVTLAGDVTGVSGATVVTALRGRAVSASAPLDGQILAWSQASLAWQPTAPPTSGTAGALPGGLVGQVQFNAGGGTFGGIPAMSGDATWDTTSGALALASVNPGPATVSGISFDQKGRILGAVNQGYLTGNQTIFLSGDVSGSGNTAIPTTIGADRVLTAMLLNGAVTYAKIQSVTPARLLGNPADTSGTPSEISLGTGLSFSGSVLNAAGGGTLAGDVTGASSANTVVRLQNRNLSATAPLDGQVLTWDDGLGQIVWRTPSTTGGGAAIWDGGASVWDGGSSVWD